jgi:hypothetical protein
MADKMSDKETKKGFLEIATYVTHLAAAIIAVIALRQVSHNQNFEKDKLAVEMFRDYAKHVGEYAGKATHSDDDVKAFATATEHAAETIYRFNQKDPGWRSTATGMIQENAGKILLANPWNCAAFHHDFYCEMQRVLKNQLLCEPALPPCERPGQTQNTPQP